MRIERHEIIQISGKKTAHEYPVAGIVVATVLLYLSPFVSELLAVAAMVLCLYRVIRFDPRVFAVDYCIIVPLSSLTKVGGGVALFIYVCLLAAIWYFVRYGFRVELSSYLIILLLVYMLLRMQFDISSYVLSFGQLFVLFVLTPKQDAESAEAATKGFCFSVILSSLYAMVFRNTWQLQAVRGAEGAAIWGGTTLRFQGLMSDPNYYMTTLIVGLMLLMKLRETNRMGGFLFGLGAVVLVGFGIISYSKTFFLLLILGVAIYIAWQFWSKKNGWGIALILMAIAAVIIIGSLDDSPFEIVLTRLRMAKNISELTTSRTEVYLAYIKEITADFGSLLFGKGLSEPPLYRDPHNLFLEILYYIGLVGLVLIVAFYGAMIREAQERAYAREDCVIKQHIVEKYAMFLMLIVLYCALHGMVQLVTYVGFFLALLSLELTPKTDESVQLERVLLDG